MKTEDIRKMAQAWNQVQEASKKKLDPVDKDELKGTHAQRNDKDIDNDGDVDKSDEYLHNRRKAVSTAIKGKGKAEVEVAETTKWPIYKRIMEKISHTAGATKAEPIDSKASQGEKDFVNMHGGLDGNSSDIDGAKAAADTAKAAAAQVKAAPKRNGDNTQGDKIQTPTDTTK